MSDSIGNPTTVTNVVNGVIQEQTAAQISAQYGAGNVKTASRSFAINHKGLHVNFFKGMPVVCDAALIAALAATGAPVA